MEGHFCYSTMAMQIWDILLQGDVSCHLKCLKEEAKSREPNLADSLQEQIQREFISRVAQLYYKKQLVIDNIRREDCLEANGTSVLAQAV